jgi:hypothetical protein
MPDEAAPTFYARQGGAISDWWTVLHPPYTAWHLSYVVLGAAVAPHRDWTALVFTVLAFFLAVGLAAHALDELHGRPLRTGIGATTLWSVALVALVGATAIGLVGALFRVGPQWALLVAVPVGAFLVVAYNLELFGGHFHTDHVFAWAWGGFPVVVGLLAQAPEWSATLVVAAVGATLAALGTSYAQRFLSTPARRLRRGITAVSGTLVTTNGGGIPLQRQTLLKPLEQALLALSWAVPAVAATLLFAASAQGR